MNARGHRGDSVTVPGGSSSEVRRLAGLVAQVDVGQDPVEWANRCHDLALALAHDGHTEKGIAALLRTIDVLRPIQPPPPMFALAQLSLSNLYRGRSIGDPDDNRDMAIEALQRCTGTEMPPLLIAKVFGSLGDLYARRKRGDRAQNQQSALEAYHRALVVVPPLVPAREWAINCHHLGLTLLECVDGDPVTNAAESLTAHWQAASAAGDADRDLHQRAMLSCVDALAQLERRLSELGAPSPFEVARGNEGQADSDQGLTNRLRATVGVNLMERAVTLVLEEEISRVGSLWDKLAKEAADVGMPSLGGVAQLNLGRLYMRLGREYPNNVDLARVHFSQALLAIDPALHPWAWARAQREFDEVERQVDEAGQG